MFSHLRCQQKMLKNFQDNVDVIKWPPQLTEDAVELYKYKNSEISAALFDSRPAVIAILLANDPSIHPIIADYDGWMAAIA
ncbi:hypothetical protein B0H14DRAFT_3527307 [Mycena olivaceomarginata]|nr:hypothetical protein B0H14DRAFT_3527307 [Mycena olivaceomarginata]